MHHYNYTLEKYIIKDTSNNIIGLLNFSQIKLSVVKAVAEIETNEDKTTFLTRIIPVTTLESSQ
jgi:hypothetical protein